MRDTDSSNGVTPEKPVVKSTTARIGVGLILLSGVLWFSLFAIPFLPLSIAQKGILAAVVFVGVQVAWWTGAALAGPATVKRVKSLFRRKR